MILHFIKVYLFDIWWYIKCHIVFYHLQVSVTNDIFQHLGQPRFLLCPTQYCATRAMPNVASSEYLNTLGSKLAQEIDIMWTGPKVISRLLTVESIEEITEVLRRPPVIWDNLHANDYDQKRVFLGPYSGRSPDLIPKLRGVLTNPNCEYGANFIAIHTLAQWSRCNVDGKRDLSLSTISTLYFMIIFPLFYMVCSDKRALLHKWI